MAPPYRSFNEISPGDTFPDVPQGRPEISFHNVFLKGKPRLIGVTQIAVAILQFTLGIASEIMLSFCLSSLTGYNFWGSVCLICTGSVNIAASKRRSTCIVKTSFVFNFTSIFISLFGIIMLSIDIAIYENMIYFMYGSKSGIIGIICVLLVANVLQLALATLMFIAGSCCLRHTTMIPSEVYTISTDMPPPPAVPPPYCLHPPPYTDPPPLYSNIY
ncbi:membrane-spanning 4-domains subfamily A member 4A-like isoform X1 [Hyperolius riggenbachi]|uniref:membrane-spanning 4-domains subfamily A member 4A-like isoform X1 n=1 Tax=Hyperolius riggenbachi TaxID=752182 RepID=UPI0035A2E925